MGIYKYLKISISIIFSFSLLAFTFPASAQKVLQCAPGMATVNNNLTVNGNLQVNNNATVANDLTVNKDIFAASGVQRIYLGPDTASPYIANNLNGGEGILFYSNGGQNFLWQSPNGTPGSDAMILKATPGLPTNNNFNLQVYGQVSPYQLHTMGIHLDMQGGIGAVPRPNIFKITNSAATGNGAAIFLGDPGAYDDNSIIFSEYTAGNNIGKIMMAMNTASGNVGVATVNPQITLAIGDNDTGLKWISDGNFQLVSNGTQELTIDPGNIRVRNNLCLNGECKNAWPAAVPETDPTVLASVKDGVAWGELSSIPADIADGDQVGITIESDPTVLASVKDGVSWGELSSIPADIADGDQVGSPGSGTINYIAKWTAVDALGNSQIFDNGTNVGIGVAAFPNTKLHVNAPAGSAVFRLQTSGDTKMFMDSTGFIGMGGFFIPSNALDVLGNIEAYDILNQNQRSLLSTVYVNSDNNGNPVWTSDILTINDATSNGGWYWASNVPTQLSQPALGFRLRGSSDDGGVCQIWVSGLFAANITNRGYSSIYTLDGAWPAGGLFSSSGSGGMRDTSFIFSSLANGENLFQVSDTDSDGNPDIITDDWGYLKPVGLDMIPEGELVSMRGGRADGAAGEYVKCSLDVLYATQYKPN